MDLHNNLHTTLIYTSIQDSVYSLPRSPLSTSKFKGDMSYLGVKTGNMGNIFYRDYLGIIKGNMGNTLCSPPIV